MEKIENQITDLGLKGFVGKFMNIISFDILFEEDTSIDVTKNRKRVPRIFFGKFKYFKEYNKDEAILIRNIYSINQFLNNNYYPIKIIKGKKEFYLFTTIAMFCSDYSNYNLRWNIDYFAIKNAEAEEVNVKVYYNQMIDSKSSCWFKCESEDIAKKVANCLNEEKINNKENLMEI